MRGDRARSALGPTRFQALTWVDETGSTNADLMAEAKGGAAEGRVLVADHQQAGRGRLDRTWEAPAGSSLLVSILLRPPLGPGDAHLLTTALALAAAAACEQVAGVRPALKWPNDLVAGPVGDERKVGGILAESLVEGDTLEAVVLGLGLNVNWPAELPDELRDIAVALNHIVGHEVDRETLLGALLVGLDEWCDQLASVTGRRKLVAAAREESATIGRRVRVEQASGSFVGEAVDITDDGVLLVRDDEDGDVVPVTVGDVIHVRHA